MTSGKKTAGTMEKQGMENEKNEQSLGEKKLKKIGYIAIAIALGILGYWYYDTNVVKPQQLEAQNISYEAQNYYENAINMIMSPGYAAGFYEQYAHQYLEMAINGKLPDSTSSETFAGLIEVAEDYPSTDAGKLANYQIGTAYLHLGQYENAIAYLKKFEVKDVVLYPMALGCIGDAYVNLEQYDEALSHYMRAVSFSDNNITTGRFLKKAALLEESRGNKAEALKLFRQLKSDYPNTIEGRSAEFYIDRTAPN